MDLAKPAPSLVTTACTKYLVRCAEEDDNLLSTMSNNFFLHQCKLMLLTLVPAVYNSWCTDNFRVEGARLGFTLEIEYVCHWLER